MSDSNEEKQFQSISVPQKFAWTLLGTRKEREDEGEHDDDSNKEDNKSGASFATSSSSSSERLTPHISEYPLWNILGYALDEENYLPFMLVSKQWKEMVTSLEPPAIFRMSKLLQQIERVEQLEQHLGLLSDVLNSLSSRSSPLYRHTAASHDHNNSNNNLDEGSSVDSRRRWPPLQPQFNIVLMQYAHHLCTHRHHVSPGLYQLLVRWFEVFAQKTIETMWSDLENQRNGPPLELLECLFKYWAEWNGVVNTVVSFAGYLGRYYVRHHPLLPLDQVARNASVTAGLQVMEATYQEELFLPSALLRHVVNHRGLFKDPHSRNLLLEVSKICTTVQSWWSRMRYPQPLVATVIREAWAPQMAFLDLILQKAREEEEKHGLLRWRFLF